MQQHYDCHTDLCNAARSKAHGPAGRTAESGTSQVAHCLAHSRQVLQEEAGGVAIQDYRDHCQASLVIPACCSGASAHTALTARRKPAAAHRIRPTGEQASGPEFHRVVVDQQQDDTCHQHGQLHAEGHYPKVALPRAFVNSLTPHGTCCGQDGLQQGQQGSLELFTMRQRVVGTDIRGGHGGKGNGQQAEPVRAIGLAVQDNLREQGRKEELALAHQQHYWGGGLVAGHGLQEIAHTIQDTNG
mmetsp:Transcript_76836/g.169721  ORF Transcript_76836/g.169721 Transcript_76836/m.169721 type:complete len:244 (-) Transcript_76836:488-1219(-)